MKQLDHMGKIHEIMGAVGTLIFVLIVITVLLFWYPRKGIDSIQSDSNTISDYASLEEGSLVVTFLDEGKADAIVIHTNHSTVLIDTGLKSERTSDYLKNSDDVENYLEVYDNAQINAEIR